MSTLDPETATMPLEAIQVANENSTYYADGKVIQSEQERTKLSSDITTTVQTDKGMVVVKEASSFNVHSPRGMSITDSDGNTTDYRFVLDPRTHAPGNDLYQIWEGDQLLGSFNQDQDLGLRVARSLYREDEELRTKTEQTAPSSIHNILTKKGLV